MELILKCDVNRANRAMTLWLLGKPGELIPFCATDDRILSTRPPDSILKFTYRDKKLTVYINGIVSNIETRELWLMTYLQKVE